jgi:LCP family protein required for cell wall assembly
MDATRLHDPGATAPQRPVQPDAERSLSDTVPATRRLIQLEDEPTPSLSMPASPRPRRRTSRSAVVLGLILGVAAALFLLGPWRTTVLLLGIDRAPQGTAVARSDTMILLTIMPPSGYVGMLSLPRDLWVTIPGVGTNRINTAHFFGEGAAPGSGPGLAVRTVRENFGLDVDGYARLTFDGIIQSVDALGGVVIDLPTAMSGYAAGEHRLDGKQALAFVRDRAGSDDFFRMQRGQVFLKAVLRQTANPLHWLRVPRATAALLSSLDSNLPPWEWPRLLFAMLRAGPDRIDARTITREMVLPFTTDQGAQVLAPNWERINPVLLEMLGQ